MKRIRIASPGWSTFTGYLGITQFVDGRSVGPVSDVLKNKLAGQLSVVDIDDDTGEETAAGVAAHMPEILKQPAPMTPPLRRATDEELAAEQKRIEAETVRGKHTKIYTTPELEFVASEKGIAGLREIAKPWGVKDRSIPGLIREILRAQKEYVERRNAAEAARNGEAAVQQAQEPDRTPNAVNEKGENVWVDPTPKTPASPAADTAPEDDKVIETGADDLPPDQGAV